MNKLIKHPLTLNILCIIMIMTLFFLIGVNIDKSIYILGYYGYWFKYEDFSAYQLFYMLYMFSFFAFINILNIKIRYRY